jgi:methylisocitrate lyase
MFIPQDSTNAMAITITFGANGRYYVDKEYGREQGASNIPFMPIPGSTKLSRMLTETNELIVCPGVYDGLSARIAMQLDFRALYMVGPFELLDSP